MRASATVVAERADGRTRFASLRSDPPIALRPTPDALYLVGSAAGPVGGDDVRLDVTVGAGADLTVRTAAATVALPGPRGLPSCASVRAEVGAGGVLWWLPEPTIAVRGCDHRARAHVRVEDGGTVVWREEVVLGRHGEAPGSLVQRLSGDVAGRPLVRTEVAVGPLWPGWDGPCGLGAGGGAGTLLVVGTLASAVAAGRPDGGRAAVLDLEGPGVLVSAVAERPGAVRDFLDGVVDALRVPA